MTDLTEKAATQARFTAREKARLREGQPIALNYDSISPRFAVQAFNVIERTIGKYNVHKRYTPISSSEIWDLFREKLTDDFGVLYLYRGDIKSSDDIRGYLINNNRTYAEILETIETCFSIIKLASDNNVFDNRYQTEYGPLISIDVAVSQLNGRLREHDLGYRFEPGIAQIVRLDSNYLHAEVVEPAISLLLQTGFEGALEEFAHALQHYRKQELADAVVDANNAFESTMKAICRRRGVPLSGDENANVLITKMTQIIVPAHFKSSLGSLATMMQALPTLRNKTPSAGHGQGMTARPALDHLAAYSFHLAAANIVFLIEAWQSLEELDTAE